MLVFIRSNIIIILCLDIFVSSKDVKPCLHISVVQNCVEVTSFAMMDEIT